jgi:hypothetical protein
MQSGTTNYIVPELGEMGSDHCRYSKVKALREGFPRSAASDTANQDDVPQVLVVNVGVAIIAISEIDIITQKFHAEFQLDQSWHDPEFCAWMQEREEDFKGDWQGQMFKKAWHPNLFMINQDDIFSREGWWNVDTNTKVVTLKVRMKGMFRERFELSSFPFDVQNLRLEFQSSWANDKVQFKSMKSNSINRSRCLLEEWTLGPKVLIKSLSSDIEESRQGQTYGRVQVFVHVARQWKFYACELAHQAQPYKIAA